MGQRERRRRPCLRADSDLGGFDRDGREKAFARGANRETINACTELDLSLDEFVEIGLSAMQSIDNKIGL